MNVVDAWQAVLEREYAALYGYGIVGARLNVDKQGDEQGDEQGSVRAAMKAHAMVRDRSIAAIQSLGGTPVPAAPAYTTEDSSDDRTPRQLATAIEVECAYTYLQLIGADGVPASEQTRTTQVASRWLHGAAKRQWEWSGEIPAWPGFS